MHVLRTSLCCGGGEVGRLSGFQPLSAGMSLCPEGLHLVSNIGSPWHFHKVGLPLTEISSAF
jgi:hypothetical protein